MSAAAWQPSAAQRAAARDRVAATWARLLADQHPGHRFLVEWQDDVDVEARS